MLGVLMLRSTTPVAAVEGGAVSAPARDIGKSGENRAQLLMMLCGVPLVCGVLQLLLWSQYTLSGSVLDKIRRQLQFRPIEV
jgi:hypothetical protein